MEATHLLVHFLQQVVVVVDSLTLHSHLVLLAVLVVVDQLLLVVLVQVVVVTQVHTHQLKAMLVGRVQELHQLLIPLVAVAVAQAL
jgi:hypothetical protein